jgi:NADPH2:quinone reductase
VLRKRLTISGSTLRARNLAYKSALIARVREHAWPLAASGRVQAVVHSVFPAAEASAAHALMESGAHVGKIVLRW